MKTLRSGDVSLLRLAALVVQTAVHAVPVVPERPLSLHQLVLLVQEVQRVVAG